MQGPQERQVSGRETGLESKGDATQKKTGESWKQRTVPAEVIGGGTTKFNRGSPGAESERKPDRGYLQTEEKKGKA